MATNRVLFTNDDLLPKFKARVLITHGEQDASATLHQTLISHAKISFYANVGHSLFLEDANRFNRELRAFINGD